MPANYCHNCGKKALSISSKFCSECGTNLASLSSSPPPLKKLPSYKSNKTFVPKISAINKDGDKYESIDPDDGHSVDEFSVEMDELQFEMDERQSNKETLKQMLASPCPPQSYPTEPQEIPYDEKTFRAEFMKEAGTTKISKEINGD